MAHLGRQGGMRLGVDEPGGPSPGSHCSFETARVNLAKQASTALLQPVLGKAVPGSGVSRRSLVCGIECSGRILSSALAGCRRAISQLGGRMASDAIFEVTDSNFDQEVLKSDQPVMVDFWAAWCGPCRALAPLVDEIAKSYLGKVRVAKMDVDKNMSTPQRYGVRGIPTLLIFRGGQVREQIVGYVPKETIQKALDKNLVVS